MKSSKLTQGFTLVELAIVIVIIGLITGGILGANSLIKSAKTQALIKERSSIFTATKAFKLEYSGLPGDFNEASSYWPTDCVDGTYNDCDGNNDKIIAQGSTDRTESVRAWQHLSLADILPDYYSGGVDSNLNSRYGIASQPFDANTLPKSKYSDNMGYIWGYTASLPSLAAPANSKQCLFLGNLTEYSTGLYTNSSGNDTGVFTIREIYDLDKKIDDGKPFSGIILGFNWTAYSMTCYSATNYNSSASYFDSRKGCGMCFVFN